MGGGSNRKPTDQPFIRTPKGSGEGGGSSSNAADVCIPSFETALEGEFKPGSKLTLDTKAVLCAVLLDGVKFGELNDSQSRMVQQCESLGVVYIGKIITDKEKRYYARFHRSSS